MFAAGAANAAAPYLKKSEDTCNVLAEKRRPSLCARACWRHAAPGLRGLCHGSVATRGLLPNDQRPSRFVQQQRRPGSGVRVGLGQALAPVQNNI